MALWLPRRNSRHLSQLLCCGWEKEIPENLRTCCKFGCIHCSFLETTDELHIKCACRPLNTTLHGFLSKTMENSSVSFHGSLQVLFFEYHILFSRSELISDRIPLKPLTFSYFHSEYVWCTCFAWFQFKTLTPTPNWLSFLHLQEQGFVEIQSFYWNQELKQDFHHPCCNDYRGDSGANSRGLKAMGSTALCYSSHLGTMAVWLHAHRD